jgi:PAS domain S-box-containing protein
VLQVADGSSDGSPADVFDGRLIDELPLAVVVCDADGRIVGFNTRADELAGPDLRMGDRLADVVALFETGGATVSGDDYPLARVLRSGDVTDEDLCLERTDGSRVPVRVSARALNIEGGTATRILVTFQEAPVERSLDPSRATLAAIVDSSDDAIVSKTLDGVITSWNAAAERIFGYTADEAIGRHISLIIPKDRLAEESEVLARLRRGEKIDHFETVRQTKDGRLIDISLTVSPVRGPDGQIIGASKVARDVTEQNAARRALSRSQRRYRRLFDSAGVALWEQDFSGVKAAIDGVRRQGFLDFRDYVARHPEFVDRCLGLVRTIDVNRSTLRMLGARSKRELVQSLAKVFDESTRDVFAEELVAIAEGRASFEAEVSLRSLNGERIDAMISIRFPQAGSPGDLDSSFDSVLVGLTDITQRRQAEQALRDSEALFREMADSAPAILWITDASGRFTFLSRRWQEFTGLSGSEVLDTGWWSILHPDDRLPVQAAFAETNLSRVPFVLEFRLRRAAGDYRWVLMPGEPRFDENGGFLGYIGSVIDITERRVAEDTLRAESQIRETLANVGASLASELNPEKLVQAVTDAATHLTSAEFGAFFYRGLNDGGDAYELHAVAGLNTTAITEPPDADAMAAVANAFRHEGIVRLDDLAREPRRAIQDALSRLAGTATVRSYLAVPVVSRSREVLGGLLFGHSEPGIFVTRHEQLAAGIASWAALALDNARLYKAARDANATKDEFLATLSHELRTPLNAMLGWTHLLRSGALSNDMRQRALDALERNGRAQAQLIDDLLDVSRIVSGRLQLKGEDVEIGGVIASAIDTIRPAADAKELSVRAILPDTDSVVTGDADRLRQVFWNLLTNAVKFTPPRGTIEIEMRSVDGGAGVTVQVRDTGVGIGREFLAHAFERFRQADSSHSRKHGGLGLGLAIVRHLVEAHGGSVAVASEGEGLGTTFTVHLPVHAGRRSWCPADANAEVRDSTLAGLTILVVDDERDAREFLAALLSLHGANVEIAASAGEALGIIAGRHIDVLLADLGLPGRDGYALIQAIRSLDPAHGGAVPAVAVTAYAGLRERERAFEVGYGWHVAKPVDPVQLLSVVSAASGSLTGDDRSRQVTTGNDG